MKVSELTSQFLGMPDDAEVIIMIDGGVVEVEDISVSDYPSENEVALEVTVK